MDLTPEYHRMINTLLIFICLLLASGMTYFLYLMKEQMQNPKTAHNTQYKLELKTRNIHYSAEIQRIMLSLKYELNCTHVGLNRFHNNGYFANGMDMEKFSMITETPYKIPLMQNCQNVFNTRYSLAFEILHILHEYSVDDKHDCRDPNFKQDMAAYGFDATHLFLIQQANGSDEGFLGINYDKTYVMTSEQKNIVKSVIPRLRDLLNLKEGLLKIRES